jgi:polyhydroxybutyrate depolymerase
LPVLVVLHGRGLNPTQIERITAFPAVVGPAIVVYPAGYHQSWNAGACCGPAHAEGVDDVGFLRAVVGDVLATQPDALPRSVFLAGYSNGGRMAYRMACADPGQFAGVAAVEAVAVYRCPGSTPVPILSLASTGDPLLRIGVHAAPRTIEHYAQPTVDDVVAEWRANNGCRNSATTSARGSLLTTRWLGCARGAPVELSLYLGGSHAWPGGDGATPAARRVVWDFFRSLRPTGTRRGVT